MLNEELQRMKYLFGHNRGVVISEQEVPQNTEIPTEDIPFEGEQKDDIKLSDDEVKKIIGEINSSKEQVVEKLKSELNDKRLKTLENYDPNILDKIASAFLTSEYFVPKDFDKNPNGYEFKIRGLSTGGGPIEYKFKEKDKIPYISAGENVPDTIDEKSINYKDVKFILEDVNTSNSENFMSGVQTIYRLSKQNVNVVGEGGKINKTSFLMAKPFPTNMSNKVAQGFITVYVPGTPGELAGTEGYEKESGMGTKTYTKQPTKEKIILDGGFLNPNDKSKFTFIAGKSQLQPGSDKTLISAIRESIKQKMTEKFGADSSKYYPILTGLKITSSASNYWGGALTPTHSNKGEILPNQYNKSVTYTTQEGKSITTNQGNSKPQDNYNLAVDRGKVLSNLVLNNLENIGFKITNNQITPDLSDVRITDTFGRIDDGSQPFPGQYARVEVDVDFETDIEKPGDVKNVVSFNGNEIYLLRIPTGGKPVGGLIKNLGISWERGKYLKNGPLRQWFCKTLGICFKSKWRSMTGRKAMMKFTKTSGTIK